MYVARKDKPASIFDHLSSRYMITLVPGIVNQLLSSGRKDRLQIREIKCGTLIRLSTILCFFVHEKTRLFLLYANNQGADQPVHPHSLISIFVTHNYNKIHIFLHMHLYILKNLVPQVRTLKISMATQMAYNCINIIIFIFCLKRARHIVH